MTKIQFWSRNQSRGCQINQIPLEPCCNLLTKNIFSSRKALHPSWYCHFRRLGSEQIAVGGLSIFVKNVSNGRRFSRSAAHRSELHPSWFIVQNNSAKGESASPADWSPVRNSGVFFVKKWVKLVTPGSSQAKRKSDFLDENRSVVQWRLRSATALWAMWYRYRLRGLRLVLRLVLFNGNLWPSFTEWKKWTSFREWKNDRHSQNIAAHPFRNDNHIRHFEMI